MFSQREKEAYRQQRERESKQDMGTKVSVSGPSFLLAFIVFWIVGGWTRVDCALGVPQACAEVQGWYNKPVPPAGQIKEDK